MYTDVKKPQQPTWFKVLRKVAMIINEMSLCGTDLSCSKKYKYF